MQLRLQKWNHSWRSSTIVSVSVYYFGNTQASGVGVTDEETAQRSYRGVWRLTSCLLEQYSQFQAIVALTAEKRFCRTGLCCRSAELRNIFNCNLSCCWGWLSVPLLPLPTTPPPPPPLPRVADCPGSQNPTAATTEKLSATSHPHPWQNPLKKKEVNMVLNVHRNHTAY